MNFSFFCKHCGKHLRQGNHSRCKQILRAQRSADRKPATSTASEHSQKFLAKTGEGE